MKNPYSKGFATLELVAVMFIVLLLAVLALFRFAGYAQAAKLSHITYDIKVLQNQIDSHFLLSQDFPGDWPDMSDLKLKLLAQQGRLFSTKGKIADIDLDRFRIIPTRDVQGGMHSQLPGTFYADRRGRIYYEDSLSVSERNEDVDVDDILSQIEWKSTPIDYFTFSPETGTITEFHPMGVDGSLPKLQDVVIPRVIGEVRVERIGPLSFRSTSLYSLVMPDTITYIDSEAFRNNSLSTLIITGNITYIGDEAFRNNHLEDLELGESLKHIGINAFRNNALRQVIIPENTVSIGQEAFRNNQLTKITIPAGVEQIDRDAFRENSLVEITIGSGVNIDSSSGTMGSNGKFLECYVSQGRAAGVYQYVGKNWSRVLP